MDGPFYELLHRCTVRVIVEQGHGAGFFVGPGKILTCAHVVENAYPDRAPVAVRYQGQRYPATIEDYHAKPYPDLALLHVDLVDHPCVHIDPTIHPRDPLFTFGFPLAGVGGDSVTPDYEGVTWLDDARTMRLLKFGKANIEPGYSGAPLVNLRTWAVCGVVKSTRHEFSDLGGRAIPIDVARELMALPRQTDPHWTEAATRQGDHAAPAAGLGVVVYDENRPGNGLNCPAELFGREPTIDQVDDLLDQQQRVLLHGLAGNGKTALAATLADRRLRSGKGSYAWLETGQSSEEAIFEALLAEFGSDQTREKARHVTGDLRLVTISDVLERSEPTLLVLDNVWNGPALASVLRAVPTRMAVLVTSRVRFSTSAEPFALDHAVEVGDLPPDDALRLLAHHAQPTPCEPRDQAEELCREFGHHAYAIVIAGCQLRHYDISPTELRQEIRHAPHDVLMPPSSAVEGRESVKRLLDRSYNALDPTQAATLRAFGALPSAGATMQLLATYLGTDDTRVRRSLDVLTELSLAKRLGGTRFYGIHDLTFSYARALARVGLQGYQKTVGAVRAFVATHRQDHSLLALDIQNVLRAAALPGDEYRDARVAILGSLATGGYIDKRGHAQGILAMLDSTIEEARSSASDDGEVLHWLLCKRGNAHVDRGEMDEAVEDYREALAQTTNPGRQAILLSVIGKVLAEQGEYAESDALLEEAHALAKANNDDEALLRVLEQQSVAAFRQGDFARVRDVATTGIPLSRKLDAPSSEATLLSNLGSAEFNLGVRAARELHEQARVIAARIDDVDLSALAHQALGIDHHALQEYEKAKEHLNEALRLYEELGHTQSEREVKHMLRQFGYLL